MTRASLLLLSTCVLAGCALPALPTGPRGGSPEADELVGNPLATKLELAIQQSEKGLKIALDPSGKRLAYVSPDGVFVADLGGTPRKLGELNGSVREMVWTPDGSALLLSENEIEARCEPNGLGGTVCGSSSGDDYARLERVTLADGKRTLLREHVYGLNSLTVASTGEAVAFLGSLEPSADMRWKGVNVLQLEDGSTATLAAAHRVREFHWSPDGKSLALLGAKSDDPLALDEVLTVTLADQSPRTLGDAGERNMVGPFWNREASAVRLVMGYTSQKVPVQEFHLDGQPGSTFDIPLGDGMPGVQFLFGAPDGSYVLATLSSGVGSMRVRKTARLDLDKRSIEAIGPGGEFVQWVGSGPRFVSSSGSNWQSQAWYVVTL